MQTKKPVIVLTEQHGGVAILRLNRPEARNALNQSLRQQLAEQFEALGRNPAVRCIVLTGGDKVFAAGADLKEIAETSAIAMHQRQLHRLWQSIADCPKPVIAAVNGYALGGGCELAIACDMVLASEKAKFGQPEIKLGVFPPIAAILLPRQVPMTKVMELLLGGGIIDAKEAHRIGMVNAVFAPESFAADCAKYLEQFTTLSRVALLHTKKAVKEAATRPFYEALHHVEHHYLHELMATEDAVEGLNSFMEKRKPVWKNK